MALTATKDAGSESIDKKPSEAGWYEASETWTVKGATSSDTRYTVVNCSDLPTIGTEDSEGVFCVSRNARRTDDPTVWKVDVRFASVSQGGLTPGYWTYDIPTERPPQYVWRTIHYDGPIHSATTTFGSTTRVPVVNSAGDPFDPPFTEDLPRIGLVATRFEANFDPLTILYYSDRVASDSFMGFPAGAARCVEINADPHYENGVACYRVSYQFEFDEHQWAHRPIDVGGRALDDNGVLKVVGDENGVSHGGLVLLDGTGKMLPRNQQASFVTLTYHNRYAVAFGPLGFT